MKKKSEVTHKGVCYDVFYSCSMTLGEILFPVNLAAGFVCVQCANQIQGRVFLLQYSVWRENYLSLYLKKIIIYFAEVHREYNFYFHFCCTHVHHEYNKNNCYVKKQINKHPCFIISRHFQTPFFLGPLHNPFKTVYKTWHSYKTDPEHGFIKILYGDLGNGRYRLDRTKAFFLLRETKRSMPRTFLLC